MIVGIGTDLCRISRMEKALASPAFFHRVFGPEEQALLERRTGAGRLATAAANFAAKEAFLKAAGVGLGGFSLGDIQVLRQESGAPFYHLSGTAAAFAQKLTLHLTLSHEGNTPLPSPCLKRQGIDAGPLFRHARFLSTRSSTALPPGRCFLYNPSQKRPY